MQQNAACRRLHSAAALAASLALAACTGMNARYPSYAIAPAEPLQVIPITADFITRTRQLQPAQAPKAESASLSATGELLPEAAAEGAAPAGPAAPYLYRIQPTDVLDISVPPIVTLNTPNAPSILGDQGRGYVVYDDGTLYLPFAESVRVAGLSLREAQQAIVTALRRYLKVPEVVVSVREFRSQRVMVTGQVTKPGYLPITDVPLTLVGALSVAGGVTQPRGGADPRPLGAAGSQNQIPAETPDLHRVLLRRGTAETEIDVAQIFASGDISGDVVLQHGDVVVVPPSRRMKIFMLGEVLRPALLEVPADDATLAEALWATGGINQLSANASRVYVIRGDFKQPSIYQLDAASPEAVLLAQRFPIHEHDVIYVAEAAVTRWNRFLQQVLPSVQGLLSTAVIADTVNDVDE